MAQILSNIVLTGAGASFLLLILARLLPNDQVRAFGYKLGQAATAFGVHKLGKAFWEKIEDFLENSSTQFFEGLREGLDSDDSEPPVVGEDRGPSGPRPAAA